MRRFALSRCFVGGRRFAPGRRFVRGRSLVRNSRLVRSLFSGVRRGRQVGVSAPVQQDAFHGCLPAVQQNPAAVHLPVRQPDGEVGCRGGGPHPEDEVCDRQFPDVDLPRQGRGAVRLFGGSALRRIQKYIPVSQRDTGNADRFGRQADPAVIHGELSGGDLQVHACRGISVMRREFCQFETPHGDLFAEQGPHGDIQRKVSAGEERVALVAQQRIVHGQPQREGEPQTLHRQVHSERPGCVADSLAPDEILNGRDVEQGGDQYQDEEDDEQRPERIFQYLFQHLQSD